MAFSLSLCIDLSTWPEHSNAGTAECLSITQTNLAHKKGNKGNSIIHNNPDQWLEADMNDFQCWVDAIDEYSLSQGHISYHLIYLNTPLIRKTAHRVGIYDSVIPLQLPNIYKNNTFWTAT